MQLLFGETAREAAQALDAIASNTRPARPSDAWFRADHGATWQALVDGGWLALGLDERRGGAGLHLNDLAHVVEAWGRHLVPLPFVPAMLVCRWAGVEAPSPPGTRLTYAVADRSETHGAPPRALAPFLGSGPVRLATGLAPLAHAGFGDIVPAAQADAALNDRGRPRADHAPSLPIGVVAAATPDLPAVAPMEIALLGAAELVGLGSASLALAVDYAREREQFGQPIAEFQAIQHRLANMHRDVEVARTAVVWGANDPERASGAVRVAWDRIRAVTENATQIHGGFGFTWEAGVHFHSRHVWAMGRLLAACGMRTWPN